MAVSLLTPEVDYLPSPKFQAAFLEFSWCAPHRQRAIPHVRVTRNDVTPDLRQTWHRQALATPGTMQVEKVKRMAAVAAAASVLFIVLHVPWGGLSIFLSRRMYARKSGDFG